MQASEGVVIYMAIGCEYTALAERPPRPRTTYGEAGECGAIWPAYLLV